MSLLRNLTKFQSIRKLVPTNCSKRFQATCVDKKKDKESPERKNFKALQAKMQEDIHAPVYLIMGTRDKLLYYTTVTLAVVGVIMSFAAAYKLAKRPV